MDELDKIMKEIKKMDRSKRRELGEALDSAMTDAQKKSLMAKLSSKSGKAELEKELKDSQAYQKLAGIQSKEELMSLIEQSDIKSKLNDFLG